MSIVIRPVNFIELKVYFGGSAFYALRNFALMCACARDSIFALFEEDRPAAAIVLLKPLPGANVIELSYIATEEGKRRKGYATRLVEHAGRYAKDIGLKLTARLRAGGENTDALKKILERAGFVKTDTAHIFRCSLDDPTELTWRQTMALFADKLCAWLERKGFSTVSFKDADPGLKESALKEQQSGFQSGYGHMMLAGGARGVFLEEYSFITAINGAPAALTMLIEGDAGSVIFQLITAAEKYQSAGVILLPIVHSMDKLFLSDYRTVYYCIFDSNERMHRLARQIFDNLTVKEVLQVCYCLDRR